MPYFRDAVSPAPSSEIRIKIVQQALNNKVALITGSGRGIGKAIAERYASLGADIVVNYTSNKASAEMTARLTSS